jgi:hypothetical protein
MKFLKFTERDVRFGELKAVIIKNTLLEGEGSTFLKNVSKFLPF